MSNQYTDDQKQALTWLVTESRKRTLADEFIVLWTAKGSIIQGYNGDRKNIPAGITKETLDLFLRKDLIIRRILPRGSWCCILRGKAHVLVAANFEEYD